MEGQKSPTYFVYLSHRNRKANFPPHLTSDFLQVSAKRLRLLLHYRNNVTYTSIGNVRRAKMTASTKVFSLEGKSLKMTSAEDLEPHIKELRDMEDVEEVRILGNTLGIGACKLLGEVLSTKKNLQVGSLGPAASPPKPILTFSRIIDRQLCGYLHGSPAQRDS